MPQDYQTAAGKKIGEALEQLHRDTLAMAETWRSRLKEAEDKEARARERGMLLRDALVSWAKDMHYASPRPCVTCDRASKALGYAVGCTALSEVLAAREASGLASALTSRDCQKCGCIVVACKAGLKCLNCGDTTAEGD